MATLSPQLHLHVQKYLREGRTPELLKEDLGINHTRHPELPLILFKYCQIDSPRHHQIVRECRGLILEDKSWDIVGKGFNRFFNVGELQWEFDRFNWNDFSVHSKEDGSLILLYNYQGEWHVNTSGSFGLGELDGFGGTWRELFWHVAPFTRDDLKMFDPAQTLVFELCTPYNKVVRRYNPTVFLLGVFDHRWQHSNYPSIELSHDLVDDMAEGLGVPRPTRYHFSSQEEIRKFLQGMEDEDATFEGVILHDSNGMRYKWKTSTYTALHHLKDNGNVLHPKRMVPVILANEHHEVMAVMPEVKSGFTECSEIMEECYQSMLAKWLEARDLESQKDFALAVKDHPMASLLFKIRKRCPDANEAYLAQAWRDSGERITKTLFQKKRFKFDILL